MSEDHCEPTRESGPSIQPAMDAYKRLYSTSPHWDGKSEIKNKKVIIFCEQGYGDIIQFSRYFTLLDCDLILDCPHALRRLFSHCFPNVKDFVSSDLPVHDFHIRSMSLPFLLPLELPYPYIKIEEKVDLSSFSELKVGIAWEGNSKNPLNAERSCHLSDFKILSDEGIKLFMLQDKITLDFFSEEVELFGVALDDFYDTAKLINSLDLVISVDTAVLHLAGAMGVCSYGLLSENHDPRWLHQNWYPSIKLIKSSNKKNIIYNIKEKLLCQIFKAKKD